MTKRTYASVTEIECSCGYLERMAKEPEVPIRFAAEMNEYQVEHDVPQKGKMTIILHHCPFCGGAAPESRRAQLFKKISEQEASRLQALISNVQTVQDVFKTLGTPDDDRTFEGSSGPSRAIMYGRLSDMADIHVTVDSKEKLQIVIAPKYHGGAA